VFDGTAVHARAPGCKLTAILVLKRRQANRNTDRRMLTTET